MGLIKALVDMQFGGDSSGRLVFWPAGNRNGYIVRSKEDEARIRSFVGMYYLAHLAVALLGTMLGCEWGSSISRDLDPNHVHLAKSFAIWAVTLLCVSGIPDFYLWIAYKRGLSSFVSSMEVSTAPIKKAPRRAVVWIVLAATGAVCITVFVLISRR